MKMVKRVFTFALVMMLFVSAMVFPASAASATMKSKISCFPYLYHGVVNANGVKALQKYLLTDTGNKNYTAIYNDGMDGGFGPNLEAAVRDYQKRHGIYGSNNNGTGEVYTQTWTVIANDLSEFEDVMTKDAQYIYQYTKNGSVYSFYYNTLGAGAGGFKWSNTYFARG